MIIQGTPVEPGWWHSVINFLQYNQPVIDLGILAAWVAFVYYTIRTFRQIKRQTDLQSDAFLVVAAEASAENGTLDRIGGAASELYEKWEGILDHNVPKALQRETQSIVLRMHNRGRSDVVWWQIKFTATVEPSDYLRDNINVSREECQWTIEQREYPEVIEPEDHIEVEVIKTGVFPELELEWDITYEDMRGKTYDRVGGDKSYSDSNIFADPQAAEEAGLLEDEEADEAAGGFDVEEDDLPF